MGRGLGSEHTRGASALEPQSNGTPYHLSKNPELVARIIALNCCGLSNAQIAARLGVGVNGVSRWLSRKGIASNYIPGSHTKSNQIFPEDNPSWRSGKSRTGGYVYIKDHAHPCCDRKGYVAEHRVVAEKKIGRFLEANEVAHHVNGIKDDNRPENIEVMGFGEHSRLHHAEAR